MNHDALPNRESSQGLGSWRFASRLVVLGVALSLGVGAATPAAGRSRSGPNSRGEVIEAARRREHYSLGKSDREGFLFGIGYATKELAVTFAETGVRQAKLSYGVSRWQDIEPDEPLDGVHAYHWDALDEIVTEYQSAGYSEIHVTLQSKSPWGTELGCPLGDCKPSRPRPEHWSDYEAYVRAVVERYDGDGRDDMPGLIFPVDQYEIETEADDWWPTPCPEAPGDPDRAASYLQVLDTAQRAAREAYPEVQVLPAAMLFYGLFSGEPDGSTVAARRDAVDAVDCLVAFDEEILRHPELFDAVEFHFLGDDYREIAATLRWLRGQMQASGYEKPIYPTDMPTAPALVPTSPYTETFLYPQDTATSYLDVIHDNIMSEEASQQYLDIRAWYAGEQAEFTVKLLLAAMEEEAAGMQLASMTDFPWLFCAPAWGYPVYAVWNWGIHGLVDVDWGPFVLCFPLGGFEVEQPRPAFHTLRWFIGRLQTAESVERLDLALAENGVKVYAYRVMADGRAVYALWAEDRVGQVMGESEPTATVALPVASPTVTLTHTITQAGQSEPCTETLAAGQGGQVTLAVSETPVFVEEAWPQWRLFLPRVLKQG